jgi:alkaline phosphatase D
MSRDKLQPTTIDRRRFLEYVWNAAGASLGMALLPGGHAFAAPRLGANPFTLGIASGDPTPDGIVLWTRLAPTPLEPERLGTGAIRVGWRVAADPGLRHVVARGTAVAAAELAHSVHVEVAGLLPHRDYFYQFDARGEESAIGHFRTAPREHELINQLRFAFVTCQDWDSGYYTAYRDMSQQDLDLVLHLGDYTYEYDIESPARSGGVPQGFEQGCSDLRTYRLRHALYKMDADLQAAHAAFPFAAIWDDHDVANDYSGLSPNETSSTQDFVRRRAAAYQAYYEHMPIRASVARLPRSEMRIYRRLRYGALAEFALLDDRQYRSERPCGGGDEMVRCDEARYGDYSMLGREQESWLARGFMRSTARWNLVAQQLLMAEFEYGSREPDLYWNDAWDAYPLARERLLTAMLQAKLRNPVILTGDWHSTFVNDIKLDFKDPSAPVIATELVTPAISTGGDDTPYGPLFAPMVPYNPHVKYYEGDRHGYFKATLTPWRMQLDLRYVTSVEAPNGITYTERSFVIEDGVPGAQNAGDVPLQREPVAQARLTEP